MAPRDGLVHVKEYDWRDSNVDLINSTLDHKVKYNSASSEPAWNNSDVGQAKGLKVWRIEDFQVIPWPKEKYGSFHEGDSYIVLHSYQVGSKQDRERLAHEIFFWLGSKTSQDEAGVAAYKTVELDEYLHGVAIQHREVQISPSDDFVTLFPRITILSGGIQSGFTHVDQDKPSHDTMTLLRVFKHPGAGRSDSVMVYEVQPTWQSLDDDDVFILETVNKIWVWQGRKCSPMEKAKAAQVVHDMTIAKHVDVEVVSQADSRSHVITKLLGKDDSVSELQCPRPVITARQSQTSRIGRPRRLCCLSDASGELNITIRKDNATPLPSDFDSKDVLIYDDGRKIWVWQGAEASGAEKALWLKAAQAYIARFLDEEEQQAAATSIARVVEGYESRAFERSLED